MESVTKNVMLTLKVEASTVLIGRSCRAGGSRASEQGGTGNSGCGHWWAFRLYFVNRPFGDDWPYSMAYWPPRDIMYSIPYSRDLHC